MKVVALVSGGKDSCFAMMKCIQYGHQIVALANLMPADDSVDELDSYMYQTVGHQIIVSYAECMGLPLFRRRIQGSTRHQKLSYRMTPGDEVEDMFILLNEVKRQIPSVEAVSSGAIASDYQRLRVESVCSRLGLVSLAYLWKQDQSLLLQEMIANGILAITVKVAAMGLDPGKHLGKDLASLSPYLHKLKQLYGINVCGEGGEYETLTLDCPLFVNSRIVLEDFQVFLHSPDSIAPVGVLHPLAFHLERKKANSSLHDCDRTKETCDAGSVIEVLGDCSQTCDAAFPVAEVADLIKISEDKLHISKTQKSDTFSICCWLQDSCKPSLGTQEELTAILTKIESRLLGYGLGWENVLYIHLYVANMKEFALVNETYVKFIKHEKCPFGVPSRSTIELPLSQVGLGNAYIEVLVANDHTKRVLHVQSISSWAPSCIGPYSQATLHNNILHMAGQLGLDPPTMILCEGGVTAELGKALENSEAVAKSYRCSISTSSIVLVIYCSTRIPSAELLQIGDTIDACLRHLKLSCSERENAFEALDPIFLYILLPDLPKGALVEVKPILFVPEDIEPTSEAMQDSNCINTSNCWGFHQENWHDDCIKKCVIRAELCAVILCITSELTLKICSDSFDGYSKGDCQTSINEEKMGQVSRFCTYLLDRVIRENGFSWEDTMYLRLYFPTSLNVPMETVSLMFTKAFVELAAVDQTVKIGPDPIFNLVPVLGAGSSSTSINDTITCELLVRKLRV